LTANLGGITIHNTRDLICPDTRFCMMIVAPAKRGKTTFARTMDTFTKKYRGKPTLIIAMEAAAGGGTMSIQDADVDYVCPTSLEEYNKIVAALANDTTYGGVVMDSATEYVTRFLKPYALRFPYTKGSPSATRAAGVPDRSDYQTMGEQARIDFNKLVGLTVHGDPRVRKDLLVTALEREKLSSDGKELIAVMPDLPGAMATVATAMFQTVGYIDLKTMVEPDPTDPKRTKRVTRRYLCTDATEENKRVAGDRTQRIPTGSPMDLCEIYEKYWVPTFKTAEVKEVIG